MELDDLKSIWNNPGNTASQQNLTTEIIEQMTKKKYQSTIKRITYPEIIGSLICLAAVVFIILNFYQLDTVFLQSTGVLSILLLLMLAAISFLSLRQLTFTGNFDRPYAATLQTFASRKMIFYKLQKANVLLCYLLLVTVIILFSKFFAGNDITGSKYFWIFSFTMGYIFLLFFSKYVTRLYKGTLQQTEDLLQELRLNNQ
jgi:hypothetical protein